MAPVMFASYLSRFYEHWSTTLKTQNAVVMTAVVVGVLGVFIIVYGNRRTK